MDDLLTDEQLEAPLDDVTEAMITEAIQNARDYYAFEIAASVRYMPGEDLLLIVMKSGQRVAIPVEDLQDLANADRKLVAEFELIGSGSAVHWEKLDVDFSTEGLAQGLYGNERWMKRLQEKRRSDAYDALSQTA